MTATRTHLDRICNDLEARIAARGDGWLTAITVTVPSLMSTDEWERAIEARLADSGIDQVDVTAQVGDGPASVDKVAFDAGWAE